MDKIKMAILGAGAIAHKMAATIALMPDVELYAVAARDKKRAEVFALQYGFEKAYGSYEELAQDEKVGLVYIATPHSHHAQHAMLCIRHGRPVLCEKAFTGNTRQAKEVLDLAREKRVFITEAMWTRFTPLARTLHELVRGDAIGQANMLTANLGFMLADVPRLTDPALAGGALLDLGIYPLTFASIAFGGEVTKVTSDAVLFETGVDAQNAITLHYRDGRMANIFSSFMVEADNAGRVFGETGHIVAENITNFDRIRVYNTKGQETACYEQPQQITGYEYEVRACIKALREQQLECPEMPHSETLRLMELMDSLRATWGVRYPFD